MALIESINSAINGFVWGVPMLVLLVGTGILMTLRTRGVQFRKFGYAMKNTIGKIFHKTKAGKGEMTPFQAMSTRHRGHRQHCWYHHRCHPGRPGRHLLAVGHCPHRYVYQVRRSYPGREVP